MFHSSQQAGATGSYMPRFLWYFLPSLLLASIAFVVFLDFETELDQKLRQTEEELRLESASRIFLYTLNEMVGDLLFLSQSENLARYLHSRKPMVDWVHLAKEFTSFSRTSGIYEQLRYLDDDGKEVLRIDYNRGEPAIIAHHLLQDRSRKQFFQDAMQMGSGGIYLSRVDLNREQEEVQSPHVPVLRVTTPVFDGYGKKRGVLVLDYHAAHLLQRVGRLLQSSVGESAILDHEGFWLYGPTEDRLWGFAFDNPHSMAQEYPGLWQKIRQGDQGIVQGRSATHVFRNISRSAIQLSPVQQGVETASLVLIKGLSVPGGWTLLVTIPYKPMFELDSKAKKQGLVLYLAFLVLAVIASYLLARSRSLADRQRRLERLASVFGAVAEGMVISDRSNRITEVNPAFSGITGYSRDEVIGKNPGILNSGRQPPEFYRRMWADLGKKDFWEGELWNRRKDGSLYPQWLTIVVIRDSRGSVERYVGVFTDITRRKKKEDLIWSQANFDILTGLPNRRLLEDRLKRMLLEVQRDREQVALLFIDLDKFKWINDNLGHDVGDQVLVQAASRIKTCVRQVDTVARLGGDEFVVVLKCGDDPDISGRIAGEIVRALEQPMPVGGHEPNVSASIGIALFPHHGGDIDELLRNADSAMYRVKSDGGGVQYYSERKPETGQAESSN